MLTGVKEPVSIKIGKVEPSPFVNVISFKLTEAVVNKEPVLTCVKEPVSIKIGKVEPSPFVNVISFKLTEAVVNKEPVLTCVKEPVSIKIGKVEPSPFVNVISFKLAEAVVKSEPVSACVLGCHVPLPLASVVKTYPTTGLSSIVKPPSSIDKQFTNVVQSFDEVIFEPTIKAEL